MVRPNIKMQRDTLILRDIPTSTPVEEVETIFNHPVRVLSWSFQCMGFALTPWRTQGCAKVLSIRPDYGDTWFVTFEDEAKCMDTATALIGHTFKGKVSWRPARDFAPDVRSSPPSQTNPFGAG